MTTRGHRSTRASSTAVEDTAPTVDATDAVTEIQSADAASTPAAAPTATAPAKRARRSKADATATTSGSSPLAMDDDEDPDRPAAALKTGLDLDEVAASADLVRST